MRKPRKAGFTLIEMLTVIVIIVIVLSIGVPAFTSLMKSGGLSGASREIANSLGLARQYAITHRTVTRVVFPYSGTVVTPQRIRHESRAVVSKLCRAFYQCTGSRNYISEMGTPPARHGPHGLQQRDPVMPV